MSKHVKLLWGNSPKTITPDAQKCSFRFLRTPGLLSIHAKLAPEAQIGNEETRPAPILRRIAFHIFQAISLVRGRPFKCTPVRIRFRPFLRESIHISSKPPLPERARRLVGAWLQWGRGNEGPPGTTLPNLFRVASRYCFGPPTYALYALYLISPKRRRTTSTAWGMSSMAIRSSPLDFALPASASRLQQLLQRCYHGAVVCCSTLQYTFSFQPLNLYGADCNRHAACCQVKVSRCPGFRP